MRILSKGTLLEISQRDRHNCWLHYEKEKLKYAARTDDQKTSRRRHAKKTIDGLLSSNREVSEHELRCAILDHMMRRSMVADVRQLGT